ncbi:hypothetical protein NKJ10_29005, partial [Mesorhizobium sp. M0204]|uniref:hypothetical protein n=1 Tax=Mesorhizobium sp. M0204 TaxID=2956913 RepID=UPI003336C3E2
MDVASAFANFQRRTLSVKLPISPLFGPGTSRTAVRGHREQFAILSLAYIEVDGLDFLVAEVGIEDAIGFGWAEGDG